MIRHATEMYGLILLDEELHKAFSDVCKKLEITVQDISGEDKTKTQLDEKGIDEFIDKLVKQDEFQNFAGLANQNTEVKEHVKVVQKTVLPQIGRGQKGGRDVPRSVENRANVLLVVGLLCFVGGVVGGAATLFPFSVSSGAMIVGGSAMLVSCALPSLYQGASSLYRAVLNKIGGNS